MNEGIIAQRQVWGREEYRKKREEIRLRVTDKYASAYAKASWWGKLILDMKMGYEIRRELEKFNPGYRL